MNFWCHLLKSSSSLQAPFPKPSPPFGLFYAPTALACFVLRVLGQLWLPDDYKPLGKSLLYPEVPGHREQLLEHSRCSGNVCRIKSVISFGSVRSFYTDLPNLLFYTPLLYKIAWESWLYDLRLVFQVQVINSDRDA